MNRQTKKREEAFFDIKAMAIFNLIKECGPLSRSDLARLTHVSLPTIGKCVQGLLEKEWIAEVKNDGVKKKYRARRLGLNPYFGPALGIEVGGSQLRWVVANLGGMTIASGIREVGEGKIMDVLESQIQSVLLESRIKAIGIASTGIVEVERGVSLRSPHRGDMDNIPLKAFCSERFGLPVHIDDISRSSAIAEWRLGVLVGEKNFMYLFLDEGIGLAWARNGVLYYGPFGVSGEVGHFVVDESGPRCGCGNRGCLEMLASCKAIVRDAQKALQIGVASSLKEKVSIENVVEEALKGDKFCYGLLTEAGEHIGRAMAQVLNLTGIPLIVLGGRLSKAGDLIIEPMKRMIKANALSLLGGSLEIRTSSLGEEAGVLGVAVQSLLGLLEV